MFDFRGKEKEDQKRRYEQLCRALNVDEETKAGAWDLLSRIPAEDNVSSIVISLYNSTLQRTLHYCLSHIFENLL